MTSSSWRTAGVSGSPRRTARTRDCRLVFTWARPDDRRPEGPTRVTVEIEPHGDIVRLTVTQENLADETEREAAASRR
jgi:uncharacterized protein YndB with AHSA1/START domain